MMDLRIELVRLRWGDTDDTLSPHEDHWSPSGRLGSGPSEYPWPRRRACVAQLTHGSACHPSAASGRDAWASAAAAATRRIRRRQGDVCTGGGGGAAATAGRLSQYASTAGALLLFSVLHRDVAAAVAPSLVLPGLAVAAAEVAEALMERLLSPSRRHPLPRPLPPPAALTAVEAAAAPGTEQTPPADEGPVGLCSRIRVLDLDLVPTRTAPGSDLATGQAGCGEGVQRPRRPGRRFRRRLGGLAAGLCRVSGPAAALLERILVPSALLSLAGRAWCAVHASSASLAEAVADLAAVGLSYSCLARQAQLGRLPPGYIQEMAWRRLHKAAAQRLARHLADLPDRPPLDPALAALQRCSIAAGLAVDGVPLCGALDALTSYGTGGGGDGGGGRSQLLLSFSYCHRQQQQHKNKKRSDARQEAEGEAAAAAAVGKPAAEAEAEQRCASADCVAGAAHDGGPVIVTAAAVTVPTLALAAAAPAPAPAAATTPATAMAQPTCSTTGSGDPRVCRVPFLPAVPTVPHQPPHQGCSCPEITSLSETTPLASSTASALASTSGDGDVTPVASMESSCRGLPPDQPPPSQQQVRRQTAPGQLAGSAAITGGPGSHEPAASGPAGTDPGHLAAMEAAAAAATSSAARRGLPRAASASSLRAIAAPPPPPPQAAVPPTAHPPTAPAAPSATNLAPARVAAVVMAPLHSSRPPSAAPTSAATASSRGGASPPPPPPPPHTRAADGDAPSGPCDSSTSWGSGVSCPAQTGSVCAAGGAAGAAAGAGAHTGRSPIRVSSCRTGPAAGTSSVGSSAGCRASSAQAQAAAPSPAASLWRFAHSSKPSRSNPDNFHGDTDRSERGARAGDDGDSGDDASGGCSSSGGGDDGGDGALDRNWELPALSPAEEARVLREEQAAAEALGLPLYGRTDHVGSLHAHQHQHHRSRDGTDRPTGHLRERLGLACRAAYLLAVFAPFLTLGVALLLLSALLLCRPVSAAEAASGGGAAAAAAVPGTASGGGGSRRRRGRWCSLLALRCRRDAWRLLLVGCRRSGAAFIKWGQWAATRVDLFPDDCCEALSELHDQAPRHSFAFTRRQVERSFGVPLDRMFEAFDPCPVASGSIAQIHRALMRRSDGSPLEVAVKVVHPNVELRIRQDFALLHPAATALARLRSLRSLSLPETVSQFSCTMTAQADLRVEAAHLRRFYNNFSCVASQVTTPRPLPGLVRQEVMVETWEVGCGVSAFIRRPGPLNTAVVCLGVDTYLKMLLQDNFVHTDLHPGNIMVRLVGPDGRPLPPELQGPVQGPIRAASAVTTGAAGGSAVAAAAGAACDAAAGAAATALSSARVQLVLLDFGLAEELTPVVRHHFISFLHHLLRGRGRAASRYPTQPLLPSPLRSSGPPSPPALPCLVRRRRRRRPPPAPLDRPPPVLPRPARLSGGHDRAGGGALRRAQRRGCGPGRRAQGRAAPGPPPRGHDRQLLRRSGHRGVRHRGLRDLPGPRGQPGGRGGAGAAGALADGARGGAALQLRAGRGGERGRGGRLKAGRREGGREVEEGWVQFRLWSC